MATAPAPDPTDGPVPKAPPRVALYLRVSTEDQDLSRAGAGPANGG